MATSNRRRDVLACVESAYNGKMYLCISEISRATGFGRNRLAARLDAAKVPHITRGKRKEYAASDIRNWLCQMEDAS